MPRNTETPGNTLASQRSYEQAMLKVGQLIHRLDAYIDAYAEDEVFVRGLTVRVPQEIGEDVFITVRADVAGKPMVAFHGGATFAESLTGLINRFQNRSLRWKDDQYAT